MTTTALSLAEIRHRIEKSGLAYRGAFHPEPSDSVPPMADGAATETMVLLGLIGGGNWLAFADSPEARDGERNPLDRWSRRLIDGLASALGAVALYPFGAAPAFPFQRWAQKAEPVHPSPLGLLIHPDWGLWHSYRGALAFRERLALPAPDRRPSPCAGCADKPCLATCPVEAFAPRGYDVAACIRHLDAPAGRDCLDLGCRARRACPIGAAYRYKRAQAEFHMRAFRSAQR
ncbi:MAG TPA: hypothetical protein VKY65_07725 [Alphaproteobacteria bacterium]|nr:hypothetical protein [Alphaproteobacteria bacterium]